MNMTKNQQGLKAFVEGKMKYIVFHRVAIASNNLSPRGVSSGVE